MAAITPNTATSTALEEKKKLQKSFNLSDMIFYTVATLLERCSQRLSCVIVYT